MTVSSFSTHSVCVCTHHQNTKLLAVKTQLKKKAEESEDKNIEVPKFGITY